MTETDILIIGAGLTGLSAAYHLEKSGFKNYLLAEKEKTCGGLCGSFEKKGFTFDWSGHLLHLHKKESEKLVEKLLGKNINVLKRNAWICSHGAYTPYPFQANLHGLPQSVVSECVSGFIKAHGENKSLPPDSPFNRWAQSVFGDGICKHFMYPYNEKLWQTKLSELTADWCAPFIPRPKLDEVLKGAYGKQDKNFGYNTFFRYPKRGGCMALCDALARDLSGIKTGCELLAINPVKKTARLKGIGNVKYKQLITTIPLKKLLESADQLPNEIKICADKMRCTEVYVFNFGINRVVSDKHWIYFPEHEFPFYRVGFSSNFSRSVAPKGCTSFYVETAFPQGTKADTAELEKKIIESMKKCGILKPREKIAAKLWLRIPFAYVVYDRNRTSAVAKADAFLRTHGCASIGRYGGWKYSFMEESLLEGTQAADQALKQVQ